MNFLINRLDNLFIDSESFEFIPENIKKINMNGMIVGANGKFLVEQKDIMVLVKKSGLKNQIGENMYNAVLRKPMMCFLIPTQEDEFEEGKIYEGKVVSIKEFGAFVEFAPGKEGMVHISKISKERINMVEDVLTLGDVVKCKCMGKDKMGRISFSIKDAE